MTGGAPTVTVKLFATLRGQGPGVVSHPLGSGTTAADVIRELAIPPASVSVIFVNGRHATPDTVLAPGDTLALFPPVGGG
jgi:molybdopterin converting factor small subunit